MDPVRVPGGPIAGPAGGTRIRKSRLMCKRTILGIAGTLSIATALSSALAVAQQSPPPDDLVDLSEAIYHYLQDEAESYQAAMELLNATLERDPSNEAALLFRSLCYGQLGLLERSAQIAPRDRANAFREVLVLRRDPERRPQMEAEIARLRATLEAGTQEPGERHVTERRLGSLERTLNDFDEVKDRADDELAALIDEQVAEAHAAAGRERDMYREMSQDLRNLLDRPQAVIRLLDVIAQSKIAGLAEAEAVGVKSGEIAADQASGSVASLRASAADILKKTADSLEKLQAELGSTLATEDVVRVRFFLGVLRYRQAVPRRTPEELPEIDLALLRRAEEIMVALADDPGVDANWRSYAALYLGLIVPFKATSEPDADRRGAILDEALRRLSQAAALDVIRPEQPTSASDYAIPEVVWRQREQIEELRAQPAAGPQQINDIQLSLFLGSHYDTNVVLLGERTDLPRGISDESDFGFTLGTAVDYTLTLGDRWTLGLQGRVSQLWHAEIDEFDEQRYGASAALQYEAVREEGDFGPVYLRLQYDYDYTLLGRDAFLETHRVTPNVRAFWDERLAETNLYLRYEDRDYFEPLYDRRFDRDGNYFALGFLQSYKTLDMTAKYESLGWEPWGHPNDGELAQDDPDFPARYLTPILGFEYSWDSTQGDEFDQKAYILRCGVLVPLPYGLDFDAGMEFEWEEYSHGSLSDYHRRPRRDFIQRYDMGISRTFVLRGGENINRYRPDFDRVVMTVRAHASFWDDDSNVVDRLGQTIYEYDRTLFGLSFAFAFN